MVYLAAETISINIVFSSKPMIKGIPKTHAKLEYESRMRDGKS